MIERQFSAMQESEQVIGRRGMISTVIPTMALLVTETFDNEAPVMSLLTTETMDNDAPSVSELTTETFDNDFEQGKLKTTEGFGGYAWNPNVLLDCKLDNDSGEHVDVPMTLEQENSGGWHTLKQTEFGTILDLSYPARQYRVTVPASITKNGIIYDAVTSTLTYQASYTERIIFNFIYQRRSGQ